MDIQQLTPLAASPAKTPANHGAKSLGAGGFAAQLASAEANHISSPSAPAQSSRSGGAATADGPAPVELRQALAHAGSSESGMAGRDAAGLDLAGLDMAGLDMAGLDMNKLEEWLSQASVTPGESQAILNELKALMQLSNRQGAAGLQHDNDTLLHTGSSAVRNEWAALSERLAMIEQAGQMSGQALIAGAQAAIATTPVPGGPATSPKTPLQSTALEAIQQRAGQSHSLTLAQGQAQADNATRPRPLAGEAMATALSRPVELPATLLPASQADGARTGLLEGLPSLAGNAFSAAQPAAAAAASSAAAVATGSLSAPLGSPAWPQQLGQQLLRISQSGGEQRVELQLHPAELGPLSVSLKLGEQGAQAQFLSAHVQVRQALEQALPQLREALAEQGIELGEATVGEQHSGTGNDSADNREPGLLADNPTHDALGDHDTTEAGAGAMREIALDGRVDLYA